jgi:aminoglycoside phosphotransferase (APT) family kinase protein
VWPALTRDQKLSIKDRLQEILSTLRSIRRNPEQPLGGLHGEGCKDFRRNLRHTNNPIHTVEQHDDFLFSNARFGSQLYLGLLRKFALGTSSQVCLSHGDIRPDNIIVQEEETGIRVVSGIIDWEFSGFYPCHYESTKATNCLGTDETSDWYEYLPELLSPVTWGRRWLLDYLLDRLLE